MALERGVTAESVVLCLNSGSSSLKSAVYRLTGGREERLGEASIEAVGEHGHRDHRAALDAALDRLGDLNDRLTAAGHRVVHGGPRHVQPARVDAALLEALRDAVPFAPLHLPAAVAGIEAVAVRHPDLPQVACFDTGFHAGLPERTQRLPLSDELWRAGVRRYGFHGLSYEYVVSTIGADRLGRAVLAHLGNGASLAAVHDGAPIDTTMGFTPAGGIPMSTRSGDLDPGVLVYLVREHGRDADALDRLVDAEGGLLALSGRSGDMRELLEARSADARAALAVEVFCYRVRCQIGAYAAALGGLDSLVFTGGIGERAAAVRDEVCRGLEHLGVRLDPVRNSRHDPVVSRDGGACTVRVVETDEDLMVARHTVAVLTG